MWDGGTVSWGIGMANRNEQGIVILLAAQVLFLSLYLAANIICPSRFTQTLGLPLAWLLSMAYWARMRCASKTTGVSLTILLIGLCIGGSFTVTAEVKGNKTAIGSMPSDKLKERYQTARLLEKEGRFSEALVEYERLLNLANNEPDIHFAFAALQLKLGNHGLARTHFRRAEDLYPPGSPWKQKAREALERLDRRGP